MVLKLSKIVSFLQFFANLSKISKAVIAVYVYASESSRFALLENDFGYYTYSAENISVDEFCLISAESAIFWYFTPQHLINCCSHPYKTYYFLNEHDEVFEMDLNKLL